MSYPKFDRTVPHRAIFRKSRKIFPTVLPFSTPKSEVFPRSVCSIARRNQGVANGVIFGFLNYFSCERYLGMNLLSAPHPNTLLPKCLVLLLVVGVSLPLALGQQTQSQPNALSQLKPVSMPRSHLRQTPYSIRWAQQPSSTTRSR